MSTFEIKMPKLGESITEGTIVSWSVKAGDEIAEDDVLFEVTTAKVSAEIPSPVAGKILKILFNEGDVVPVGQVVAIVQLMGDSGSTDSALSEETQAVEEIRPAPEENIAEAEKNQEKMAEKSKSPVKESQRWYSPVVLQLAEEAKISKDELESIPGTGYLGRLSKKDIVNYISDREKGKVSQPPVRTEVPEDKKAAGAPKAAPSPVFQGSEDTVIVDMDPVGRIIADHMVMSKNVSAHVTTVVEADVTKLVKWRNAEKEDFLRREGVALTYMPAIALAVTKALKEFPKVNASVDGYRYILKKRINLGIAVSLGDGNLVVPVVHDADRLSISGLAGAIDKLAVKARSNKLAIDDIEGGTFSITNFGTFKNIIGTPIINQPQVAILGVGYIEKKPSVVETPEGDVIAIRHKLYLSLSYDHRIINGAMGGEFLRRVADILENWNTI